MQTALMQPDFWLVRASATHILDQPCVCVGGGWAENLLANSLYSQGHLSWEAAGLSF